MCGFIHFEHCVKTGVLWVDSVRFQHSVLGLAYKNPFAGETQTLSFLMTDWRYVNVVVR